MSEPRHPEAGAVAEINWECQDQFPEQLAPTLPNTRRSPFPQHLGLDDAQTNEQVDARTLRELERRFDLDRTDSHDDLCNDHWSWTPISYPERTATTSQHLHITSSGGNLHQKLLQEATSQNNLSPFLTGIHPADVTAGCSDRTRWLSDTICTSHDPSFANAVNPLDNSRYSEIHHPQGNEPLVDPTNELHTPPASRHSLLSDPSLEQGGLHDFRYDVHVTTSAVIAPGSQHADGRTTAAFMLGSSIEPGQDLGRSCDHNDGPVPDAASSQTVRQHTHFHPPHR
ncbi:hypothetical protein BGW80DRAFT_882838 [Lactifluus volemus]|nr:hypothetical protein BGW80DRAFT_882838 [Lactifluus volemus]